MVSNRGVVRHLVAGTMAVCALTAAAQAQTPAPSQVPPTPPSTAPAQQPAPEPPTPPGGRQPGAPLDSPTYKLPPLPEAPTGPVLELRLDDVVRMALEQNLTIQVERINPQIQDLTIRQARSFWTPAATGNLRVNQQNDPPDSFLSGAQDKLTVDSFVGAAGIEQNLPWGGFYTLNWNGSRTSTNNLFSNFDPRLGSNLDLTISQPLLRNFRIDNARQQLLISRKNREIGDIELRQTVTATIREVKNAYWDLAYTYFNLQAQQQSLELARQTLRDNRTRVEVGTMAPIDIVEAEAEVARNEEAVIVAEAAIKQAEDQLRALIMDPDSPDFWTTTLRPIDMPSIQPVAIDIEAAVRNALAKRTDLQSIRKNLEANEINIRYFRNQTLPQLNLQVDYGLSGLGGTEVVREPGFPPGDIIREEERDFGTVLRDVFNNTYPTWTVSMLVSYPIGTSSAEASLARTRLQHLQAQRSLANQELQVATQVRNFGRQVNTNMKRVEATRAARQLAERRLEAEQKKFSVGMSTSFQVFQAQRDLTTARNNELRAILDYTQSLVDFEAVQEASIGGGSGITLVGSSGTGPVTTGSTGGGPSGGTNGGVNGNGIP